MTRPICIYPAFIQKYILVRPQETVLVPCIVKDSSIRDVRIGVKREGVYVDVIVDAYGKCNVAYTNETDKLIIIASKDIFNRIIKAHEQRVKKEGLVYPDNLRGELLKKVLHWPTTQPIVKGYRL